MATTMTTHPERWAAALGGAGLLAWGANRLAKQRHPLGAMLAATGTGLLWHSTRSDNTRARLGGMRGTITEESLAINRPAGELYRFWRDLERLPTVIPELASVQVIDDRRSHWIAKGPAGWQTEWYADIINDIPNRLIAWRTIEGSQFVSAGSVHFEERRGRRGTVVRIKLQYDVPAGKIGAAFAWAFGKTPSQVLREGLRRFKQLMERGKMPATM